MTPEEEAKARFPRINTIKENWHPTLCRTSVSERACQAIESTFIYDDLFDKETRKMYEEKIPAHFVQYAANILGDTYNGLSGLNIVKATTAHAVEYDVKIPHSSYPFEAPNKRTALYENLMVLSGPQQYRTIKELCDHHSFTSEPSKERKKLRVRLVTRYGHLAPQSESSEISETLIEETRHWLDGYPEALALYNDALEKYEG